MRARIRSFALGAAVVAVGAAAVVACGSDPAGRAFDETDAAQLPEANVPEAAAETSTDAHDASDERPPFDPKDEPITCASGAAACAVDLVAGGSHFCARMNDGTVRCWGDDAFGALGGGSPDRDAGSPADAGVEAGTRTRTVAGLSGVTQLSASGATTCARVDDGGVLCWGDNGFGQLGLSSTKPSVDQDPHPTATPVPLTEAALRVDVGAENACALLASGGLWCWGNDEQGQLARDGIDTQFVIGPGAASIGPIALAYLRLGSTTLLAVTPAGDVVSWGTVGGNDGILAGRMTSISPDLVPQRIPQLSAVSSLAVSASFFKGEGGAFGTGATMGIGPAPPPAGPPARHGHACAISGGEVSCWGRSDRGALCTGFPDAELLPAKAPIASKAWAQQVAVGDELTCARMTDGTVQCCGDDTRGRLGTGKVGLFSAFFGAAEGFAGHAVRVAASSRSVCALVQGGTVECWGSNQNGELAQGAPDDAPHPTASKVAF
ncbi:MAG: hypothetical protein JWO86_1298 [Myxococcaceae bacterium]|nr:hypothetical protein [Myxococcaceae bacterium]